MLALLSIFFALTLLGLLVFALHKYQTMEVEFNLDRSVPLPPLDGNEVQANARVDTPKADTAKNTRPDRGKTSRPAKAKSSTTATGSWQDAITALKNQGKYQEAAALCEQQLPLWGAYNQLCMLIRNEIKASDLDATQQENRISRLFRTAAIAELLHDKSGESGKLPNNQLRRLNLHEIDQLEFPYAEVGYAHLRLIRKSDIKHMVELWGRPHAHRKPREYHASWWQQHLRN